MGITAEKQTLRELLRRKRMEIPDDVRKPLDDGIFRNVTGSGWFHEADTLLLYVSCRGEADTIRIIEEALRQGKQVAVPKCGKAGQMEFFLIEGLDSLQTGAYGILEPVGTKYPDFTEKTLCFVPAVAFTSKGERLGQGGGYYDRFLEKHPDLHTVGLCYSCMMQEHVPCEAHDRCVDAVMTEAAMYRNKE